MLPRWFWRLELTGQGRFAEGSGGVGRFGIPSIKPGSEAGEGGCEDPGPQNWGPLECAGCAAGTGQALSPASV